MRARILSLTPGLVSFLVVAQLSLAHGEPWPHWRGPSHNGSSGEQTVPEKFSKTENVLWTAPMPGSSAATPIVWGQHVFITSVDQQQQTLVALCLNRTDGKVVWEREVAQGTRKDPRSNFASASPVTDGELVYFFYGTGDLAAFDFSGQKVWQRNLQKDYGQFAFNWTFSSSPTLFAGKLYMQVLQRNVPVNGRGRTDGPNESYLLALDPKTGRELWRQVRPAEAREESLESFSTLIPYEDRGRAELLVVGGDCLTGHDPATGKELWRWGTWNPSKITHWRMVVSPVAGGGVVLACGPKGAPVYAVKAGSQGNLSDSALAWVSKDRAVSSDVSTPLFYKGRFYVLNSDRRVLSCVEPATGQVLWTGELNTRSKLESSPTAAGDKIYMMDHQATVFVVQAGEEFKVLHSAAFGEEGEKEARSSVAISEGNLFVRTSTHLYCIGSRAVASR